MADDEGGAPGDVDDPVGDMERLLDKLLLLDYERVFLRPRGRDVYTRVQFAVRHGAPGQQWLEFGQAASWLFSLSRVTVERPDELSDPNASAAVISTSLTKLGLEPVAPAKLLPGFGSAVIAVLDALADKALVGFKFSAPRLAGEASATDADGAEDAAAVADDEPAALSLSDDEPEMAFDRSVAGGGAGAGGGDAGANDAPTVDPAAWALEVERVAPLLKVTLRADNKDWRSHVEQMAAYRAEVVAAMPATNAALSTLAAEIASTLDKLAARESYINQQLATEIRDYLSVAASADTARDRYSAASETVTALTAELKEVQDELDTMRDELEAKTGAMMDASPVVAVKQALHDLREDIKQLEVRIGVVQSSLWQQRLRERKATVVLRSQQNRQITEELA